MLAERMLTNVVRSLTKRQLELTPADGSSIPAPVPGRTYTLYAHVPFCERLCPYCSFNRFVFREDIATRYFESLRKEMRMMHDLGYRFESIYFGGGTPTIMIDELCETIDYGRELFPIKEIASETNPNHLIPSYLEKLKGRVQRLSVGVQSFNDDLLKQMDRYDKYGSGEEIYERIGLAAPYFESLNVDMIFNFPSQTEDILISDVEHVATSGCQQTTFSPLYVSNGTMRKMAETLGAIDYNREERYYRILDSILAEGDDAQFERCTLWTFNRKGQNDQPSPEVDIKEYAVSYEECAAIGSGSISHLGNRLYVNTFSLPEYSERIDAGEFPLMGYSELSKKDHMRYRFLLNLYGLHLDKQAFLRDFGESVDEGLPVEMAFLRLNGAFATDDKYELTLTPRGRYLVVVMYRQFLAGLNNLREQARSALTGPEHELMFGDSATY
ncbi:MAG: coproporphyrinogen III oxidase family protein [Eggerthellaceae bacterium]|nr:coproporphyrinogen III oxidase family protein [Eggerthellaceae bacterium]